jgi:hypothetical protein
MRRLAIVLVLVGACQVPDEDLVGSRCNPDGRCRGALVCDVETGRCVREVPPRDAGVPDAGHDGGTLVDAGVDPVDALVAARCGREVRCGLAPAAARGRCEAGTRAAFLPLQLSLDAGRLRVVDGVDRCVTELGDGGCEQIGSACELSTLFRGTQSVGDACITAFECRLSAPHCVSPTRQCPFRCAASGTEGTPCPAHGCRPGFFCDEATCARLPVAGQACRDVTDGGPRCHPDSACDAGLCARLPAEGQPCSADGRCQPDLFCVSGSCVVGARPGGSCLVDARCVLGERCDSVERICAVDSMVDEGETCTSDTRVCAPGLVCKGASVRDDGGVGRAGRCGRPAVGDACANLFDCPARTSCIDGRCQVLAEGDACAEQGSCPVGLECIGSRCQPVRSVDVPCSTVGDCGSPLRCSRLPADTTARCVRPGAPGATCGTLPSDSCEYGAVCVDGGCVTAGGAGQRCANELFGCFEGTCQADGGPAPTRSEGVCGPLFPEGTPCQLDSQCRSAWCHRSTFVCTARCE